jgi:hypothetical protein
MLKIKTWKISWSEANEDLMKTKSLQIEDLISMNPIRRLISAVNP